MNSNILDKELLVANAQKAFTTKNYLLSKELLEKTISLYPDYVPALIALGHLYMNSTTPQKHFHI